MRQSTNPERIPIQSNRDALWLARRAGPGRRYGLTFNDRFLPLAGGFFLLPGAEDFVRPWCFRLGVSAASAP
jgi:hypothetical protein